MGRRKKYNSPEPYMAHKQRIREWQKQYYAENKDRIQAKQRLKYKTYPHLAVQRYRQDAERQAKLREAKAGIPKPAICPVCLQPKRIVFDHCHDCGRFRGWLCDKCNLILGHCMNSPAILRELAVYLERHGCAIAAARGQDQASESDSGQVTEQNLNVLPS